MGKSSKVLVVGGTGFMGRRFVKASLAAGHETHVLHRPELGLAVDKVQTLIGFKRGGAHLVEGSFSDHQSLVDAVSKVDVVISAMSGEDHNLLQQLKLVNAIKDAGNVKRFLPSEFGMDPPRMEHALAPGRVTFEEKMVVRKAIEEAKIPFTYVVGACFAAYFAPNLAQMKRLTPPNHNIYIYGDGNVKVAFVDEDDVATYTIKTIDDPRTLNKTVYLRPPENVLTQNELIAKWENVSGNKIFNKTNISAQDFLASMKDLDYLGQVGVGHFYHIFYEGCLTNFEVDEEASKLYPDVKYTRMDEYMKIFA